jgi:hypothetical protein
MGLINKTVMVQWRNNTKKYYESKGYIFTEYGDEFEVKVEDLTNGSHVLVEVVCDNPNCENPYLKPMSWQTYKKYIKENNKYYCKKCAMKLYGTKSRVESAFKNSKSFEQWCLENNRQDILDRWDSELNYCKPSEISFSPKDKYWFKCPRGLHKSELKKISAFVSGQEGSMICNQCGSFAQWGIDNICTDFLEKYWSKENTINPWKISYGCHKKVWIKCQEKDYHQSYNVAVNCFTYHNSRCPYCKNQNGKVHPLDSLGTLYPEVLEIWSSKNKKSPYEYSPKSNQYVWWKCPEEKHEAYLREINNSNIYNFRCPECQYSKGEERISQYLINNKINYIPQKEYNGLVGLCNGLLSYDFYLEQYNLLIEFQGEQHEKYIPRFHMSIKDFEKQQEHDKRKREYAQKHNIKLLEIWYWDYENIETILDKELNI